MRRRHGCGRGAFVHLAICVVSFAGERSEQREATQHRRTLGDQPGRMPETRRDDDMAVMAHTGLTAIMTASLAGPPSHHPQVGFLPGRLPTPSPAKLAEVSRQQEGRRSGQHKLRVCTAFHRFDRFQPFVGSICHRPAFVP